MLTDEQQQQVLEDLRWYGREVAGGAPMTGDYAGAAKRALAHWYGTTLPLLRQLNAVYSAAVLNRKDGE